MESDAYCGRPKGHTVPCYVSGQYCYDYKPDYYRNSNNPRLLEFLEDFGELYNRRHELFHKIFPDSRDDFRAVSDGVLDEARSKRRTRAGAVQRSLIIGSPRMRCHGLGGDGDEVLRLERFKVKTVDLDDNEVGGGGASGHGGPVVITTTANSKS